MIRRHFVATGRVQGVFFRATTRRTARAAGLTGWVRNRPDGAVEGEVQGPSDAVADFIDAVREGPRYAKVHRVTVDEMAVDADEAGFEITG